MKPENLSVFIILLLIVTSVEFYIVNIAVTLRKQGELHRALEAEQQERVEPLSRLISAKDEERKQLVTPFSANLDVGLVRIPRTTRFTFAPQAQLLCDKMSEAGFRVSYCFISEFKATHQKHL